MLITSIEVYQVELPLADGAYKWSGGKYVEVFDSTVVCIKTSDGTEGVGEICPLGPVYLPSYAAGVRTGLTEISPKLLGSDPTELSKINDVMDANLKGHPYVKSAIDMACWDILGKKADLPVCHILGGRYGDSVPLYRAISQDTPDNMRRSLQRYRAEGYRRFQLKVGSDVETDIDRIEACADSIESGDILIADANTGWAQHDAIRISKAVEHLDVYIEQPCLSYEECLTVRQKTRLPFVLDESIDSLGALMRAARDAAMDVINIKISKFGGLTRALQARDLCASLGIAMTIEDTWGGDVATAAISHLAQSTPPQFLFTTTDFNSYVTRPIADGAPKRENGRMRASDRPGLGVVLKKDVIGSPVQKYSIER